MEQALRLFDYSAELDPQSLNACLGKALVLSSLGDDKSAEEQTEHCLELGPDYIWAHYNAAIIYLASGDTDRALQHARRVHSVSPELVHFLRCYRKQEKAPAMTGAFNSGSLLVSLLG